MQKWWWYGVRDWGKLWNNLGAWEIFRGLNDDYDSDDDESNVYSVTTSVAGMTVGYRFDDLDATLAANDNDMSTYSIGKDMGGISLTLMYEDQDLADNSEWNLVYAIGF